MSTFGQSAAALNTAAPANNTAGDATKDVTLNNPPEDSISGLAFSRATDQPNDLLAVSSWDKKVRIYEVTANGASEGRHMYEHDAPVLDVDFSPDSSKVVSAGADKQIKVFDIASQQSATLGTHDNVVRCARFFQSNGNPMIVSGSWDKTVKYWDLRQQQPAATLQVQERVYSMDVRNDLLVVATADRYINVVNLQEPTKFYKTMQSPLKWQTRTVSCFIDATGFAIGSIEGRCAIHYVDDKDVAFNFSFKCHRDVSTNEVYALNEISFNPVHGTFSTAGSDGAFHFWDKDAKHRLKMFPSVGNSITATSFNSKGTIFAYGVSYDWSKGFQANTAQYPIKVMLHPIDPEECKPKPVTKKTR